jgi:rubrerythrin
MMQLFSAFSAEQQAIAIYEAQVFWRRGPSGELFREILAEELEHRLGIEPYFDHRFVKLVITPFNLVAGWLLGTLLSVMPRKICYWIHVWAETEAAKTYEDTAVKIKMIAPQRLLDSLAHAAVQERSHATRFARLLEQRK